jgi:hypothetical protein
MFCHNRAQKSFGQKTLFRPQCTQKTANLDVCHATDWQEPILAVWQWERCHNEDLQKNIDISSNSAKLDEFHGPK